jgi:mRNA interferase RelE/StbE
MNQKISVIYSRDAYKDLMQLGKVTARRIVLKIEDNAKQSDPLARAKALTGNLAGRYRYRVGDYRVIFSIDKAGHVLILKVLLIKHRKDVYR